MCDREEISEHITRSVHRLQGGIKYAGSRSENQRDAYGKADPYTFSSDETAQLWDTI